MTEDRLTHLSTAMTGLTIIGLGAALVHQYAMPLPGQSGQIGLWLAYLAGGVPPAITALQALWRDRDLDIDLLMVGELSFGDAVKSLYPAQQQLGREINPKLYSVAEWQKALAEQSGFIRELLASPLLMIAGDKDDLRQSDR